MISITKWLEDRTQFCRIQEEVEEIEVAGVGGASRG